jgi:hypothetical protein
MTTSDESTAATTATERRRRVPPVWALLALLLLIVVGSLLAVWHAARQRMRLVEYVHDRGGSVAFDVQGRRAVCYRRSGGHFHWNGRAPAMPRWLFDLMGPTWFYPVTEVSVSFNRGDRTGELFELLEGHQHVKSLYLGRSTASGNQSEVAGITRLALRRLTLSGAWDLRHLPSQTNLQQLEVHHCRVTEDDLEYLVGFANLKVLRFNGCPQLTDDGLKHLEELRNLGFLSFQVTQVTRAGLESLKQQLPACRIEGALLADEQYLLLP